MAYIAPNSSVQLLKNVPVEPTYENTVWYRTEEEQLADFMRYHAYTLNAQSYVHKNRGVIRVELSMAQVYDCNYMLFRNASFENKWFYAFINRVEYVNNATTDIYFTIDFLQTWLKQFSITSSFIDREIVVWDRHPDWLIPESLDVGPYYVYEDAHWLDDSIDLVYVVCAPFTISEENPGEWVVRNYQGVSMVGGIPSGLHYTQFLLVETLNSALAALTGTLSVYDANGNSLGNKANLISEVAAIVLAPSSLYSTTDETYHPVWDTTMPYRYVEIPSFASVDHLVQTYPIKNKKLTAYPYMYVLATDHNGNDKIYHPELFDYSEDSVRFQLFGDTTPNGGVIAFPKSYGSFDSDGHETGLLTFNVLEGTKMGGLPTISWTVDVWKSWLSSTGIENAITTVKNIVEGLIPNNTEENKESSLPVLPHVPFTWNNGKASSAQKVTNAVTNFAASSTEEKVGTAMKYIGGIATLSSIVNNMSTAYQQSLKPNTVVGSQSGGAKLGANLINLSVYLCGIGQEAAERLDSFFDAYGYKVARFGIPWLFDSSITGSSSGLPRNYRYYVKTVGVNIHGNLPKDDADNIQSVFDSGIRFWYGDNDQHRSALENMGDYSLDNTSRWSD